MPPELKLPSDVEEDVPVVPAEETPIEEIKVPETVKEVDGETPRERALREEVTRLKKDRREARKLAPLEAQAEDVVETDVQVSRSEAVVYNSLQQDALEDFLEAHPHYNEDEDNWKSFLAEFNDRVPIAEWAKRKGVPLTKRVIRDRLDSIHRALGSDVQGAKEEGKKELLRTQSAAQVMAAGANRGEVQPTKQPEKRALFKKESNDLSSWLSKKK